MKQMEKGIFVTATDTEVGKTFVSALLIRSFRQQGIKTGYLKPVATGCHLEGETLVSEDISFINTFTGQDMEHTLHCPVRYLKPLAPLAAAQLENRPLDLQMVWTAFELLKKRYSLLVVEGIGGVMVPLKKDYLVLDMMAEMNLPTLVVCRPSLGTINHSLLTLQAIKSRGIPIIGFLTNGKREDADETALTSPDLIAKFSQVSYLGHIPYYDQQEDDPDFFIDNKATFLKNLLAQIL
jgi:dethiobiotin synthetase